MNKQNIIQIFEDIFQEVAPEIDFSLINLSKSLRDQVDIDSFDFYRIIVKVSQKINIILPESKLLEMKTLEELVNYIIEQSNHHQSPVTGH